MDCLKNQNEIILLLDDKLSDSQKNILIEHLEHCSSCNKFKESLEIASSIYNTNINYNKNLYTLIEKDLIAKKNLTIKSKLLNLFSSKTNTLKIFIPVAAATLAVVIFFSSNIHTTTPFNSNTSEPFNSNDYVVEKNDSTSHQTGADINLSQTEDELSLVYGEKIYINAKDELSSITEDISKSVTKYISFQDILNELGTPDSKIENHKKNILEFNYIQEDILAVVSNIENSNSLIELKIDKDSDFVLKNNLKIGSSLDEIIKIYSGSILKPSNENSITVKNGADGKIIFSLDDKKIISIRYLTNLKNNKN